MVQDIKTTIIKDSLDIAQSLEKTRNEFYEYVKTGLYYETVSLYLQNFCIRYSMLMHELIERKVDEDNSADVFKTAIGVQGDSRYLFELFLTTCHFFNQPEDKRDVSCLSLRLAELLHTHKQDKVIDSLVSNENTQAKLASNDKDYKNILILAKKYKITGLPEGIDGLHETKTPKVLIKNAGLMYYQNAKIEYKKEWMDNIEVKTSFAEVKKNFEMIPQPLYAIYSLYAHPTYASVEKLNDFIKLDSSKRLEEIEHEKYQTLSMIKPVAKAMDLSCKRNLIEVE